jgi:pyruvate/2-oxoglutarate dehydrogenase complex dihydrolipoamide dehydrogenase (E3) component
MHAVPRALETGETRGFMKAVVDTDTQHILGCAMLCAEGGELMTIICIFKDIKAPQLNTDQDGKLIEP